jgi:hypothetical protein
MIGLLLDRYARVLDIVGQPVEAGLFAAHAAGIRARLRAGTSQQGVASSQGLPVGTLTR